MLAKVLNYVKIGLISLSIFMIILFASDAISLQLLINFSYYLVIGLVLSTVVTAIINTVENPKSSIKFLIGIGALILFYFIGYGIATDTVSEKTGEVIAGSRQAEAGIYVLYFILAIAFSVMFLSSFKKIRTLF